MKSIKIHNHFSKRSLLFFAAALFVFSVISQFYFRVKPSIDHHQNALERHIHTLHQDAVQLLKDSVLLRKLVLNDASLEEFTSITQKEYGVFLFAETISDNQELLYWNNQKIVPPEADFSLPDGVYFKRLPNGYYAVLKNRLQFSGMTNNIMSYILIPVLHQYYIELDYLPTQFAHDENAINEVALSDTATAYPVSLNGQTLFYLKPLARSNIGSTDALTISLRLCALLLLLVFFHLKAESIVRKEGTTKAIAFLIVVLLLSRSLMFIFPSIFSFRQFALFDPTIYGANWLNRSLGDLLINTSFLCWIMNFAWNNLNLDGITDFIKGKRSFIIGVIAIFLLIISTFQVANVVESLVIDSKISFNVTDFFSLNIYSVFGFI
ncbi:MAG TPA: hypothetical protein VM368_04395, partial [Flavisolibacter sp.]|nr:hypothetical protein [Flavisolibacter sp.]